MTSEEIEARAEEIQTEYDNVAAIKPTNLQEVKYQQKKLAKLKLELVDLIDDCVNNMEVEDFLENGPGYNENKQ